VGSEPGSSQIHLFAHLHHFTAEPQQLPYQKNFLLCTEYLTLNIEEKENKVAGSSRGIYNDFVFGIHCLDLTIFQNSVANFKWTQITNPKLCAMDQDQNTRGSNPAMVKGF
jgi:hypothetical protein